MLRAIVSSGVFPSWRFPSSTRDHAPSSARGSSECQRGKRKRAQNLRRQRPLHLSGSLVGYFDSTQLPLERTLRNLLRPWA
jgi:hypothetical protein